MALAPRAEKILHGCLRSKKQAADTHDQVLFAVFAIPLEEEPLQDVSGHVVYSAAICVERA